ncbi:MAG: D-aminoacyl-tRNA deacylase [Candidatus Electronema sp. V4]|uniref:D-aminoacyl-tRNA deacylase n=1 Tax=Candidatus Electronema sp. V4 TaxID=3454756 RepID=UPI00405586B5
MRAVIQRVSKASVRVAGRETGAIGAGLLVLLGVHGADEHKDITWLADKIVNLRIFDDEAGLMNRSLLDMGGAMLIVSQFTLLGDCRKGRRPSWSEAAPPERAKQLYLDFINVITTYGISTASGEFQAMMEVSLINAGPVTILLDSQKKF